MFQILTILCHNADNSAVVSEDTAVDLIDFTHNKIVCILAVLHG